MCQSDSVDDVERVTEALVEFEAGNSVQAPDGARVEACLADRYQVVAIDHCALRQAMLTTHLHLGGNPSDRPRDRSARDPVEHRDGEVARENADRSTSTMRPEVRPIDLVSSYHSGVVSAARRSDAPSSAGSVGISSWTRSAQCPEGCVRERTALSSLPRSGRHSSTALLIAGPSERGNGHLTGGSGLTPSTSTWPIGGRRAASVAALDDGGFLASGPIHQDGIVQPKNPTGR